MFHTACSGHSTKNTPNASAISEQHERRAAPVPTGRDDRDTRQQPHPPRQPERGRDQLAGSCRDSGATPRTSPSIVCFTGLGRKTQYGSLNLLPLENTLAYRMLCVYACCPRSGSDQTAREREADGADGHRDRPRAARRPHQPEQHRRDPHEDRDHDVRHDRGRDEHRREPRSLAGIERVRERAQREQRERQRDLERVLTRERAGDVAAVDVPVGALLHEHAERGDREEVRRRPRHPHAPGEGVGRGREHDRPADGHDLERDVVGHGDVQHRRPSPTGTGSSTARPGSRRTNRAPNPTSRNFGEPVVLEEPRHPHVGAHVAAVGGRVPEDPPEVNVPDRPELRVRVDDRDDHQRADADDDPAGRALPAGAAARRSRRRSRRRPSATASPARTTNAPAPRTDRRSRPTRTRRRRNALVDQGVGHARQHARPGLACSFTRARPRREKPLSRSAQFGTRASSRTSPSVMTPVSSCQLLASHRAQRWKTTSRPAIRIRIVMSAPFAHRVQACIGGLPAL